MAMDQSQLIGRIIDALRDDTAIRGLFLAGSFGRGTDDRFSDVDFIALVETDAQDNMLARWRNLLDAITPIVFWRIRRQGGILVNAISQDWLRCDLSVMPPSALAGYARNTLKPLIDRDGIYQTLPAERPAKGPDAAKVEYLIEEFLRVLGLLPVVIGRQEYLTAVSGVGMLRDLFTNLLLESVATSGRGGALHLSRNLPPTDMQMLMSMPFPGPQRQAVIEAHFDIARQFLPRAHALATTLNLDWPEAFQKATIEHLARQLGPSPDWNALI